MVGLNGLRETRSHGRVPVRLMFVLGLMTGLASSCVAPSMSLVRVTVVPESRPLNGPYDVGAYVRASTCNPSPVDYPTSVADLILELVDGHSALVQMTIEEFSSVTRGRCFEVAGHQALLDGESQIVPQTAAPFPPTAGPAVLLSIGGVHLDSPIPVGARVLRVMDDGVAVVPGMTPGMPRELFGAQVVDVLLGYQAGRLVSWHVMFERGTWPPLAAIVDGLGEGADIKGGVQWTFPGVTAVLKGNLFVVRQVATPPS
jgi:hypothetical protein